MREPAPPYRGEGPHALWHRHLPMFWFPRECPRATFWADSNNAQRAVR
jgi:hypothetical protein